MLDPAPGREGNGLSKNLQGFPAASDTIAGKNFLSPRLPGPMKAGGARQRSMKESRQEPRPEPGESPAA